MVMGDTYSQPGAADPVLAEDLVLSLVRRHTDAAEITAVDESGGEARAYMIDDAVVLKVQRPHRVRPRTSLEKEVFFLDQLKAYPEISVPRVLGYGREDGIEYICMTRMPGVAARTLALEGDTRQQVLRDLGKALRSLHAIDQEPFRSTKLLPGDSSAPDFRERLERGFERAVAGLTAQDSSWDLPVAPQRLAERALARVPSTSTFVALHSNPGPEHTYVDPSTGKFTGLIDFGDAYVSHPAFDIRWPRPEDRVALLEGYQTAGSLPDDFLETWQAVLVLTDMTLAAWPRLVGDRRAQAVRNLMDFSRQV